MSERLSTLKDNYRSNPGWCWLIAIIFFFPLLPEYISPFLLFIGFIVFKRQWTREGKKAKTGTLGKLMMGFMTLALVSPLWSNTFMTSLATAGLWWGMFLIEVMIFNLATTRKKVDKILSTMVVSGAINGLIGAIQICTYTLFRFKKITADWVFVTPFYRDLDKAIYTWLPFEIITDTFKARASGFYSNPNLFATYMLIVYPISIYLFINSKDKKHKFAYFMCNVLISAGLSSTMTRSGCFIAIAGWLFMFVILIKRYWKSLLLIFVPTVSIIVPSILTRYGLIFRTVNVVTTNVTGAIGEAKGSTEIHASIWQCTIDYILHHAKAFIIGTGFGLEETGKILLEEYNLNRPHAHNIILQTWMDLGIIGVMFFAVILICYFGKLLEINANNGKKITLIICLLTTTLTYLMFGMTDYLFNSPKQIVLLFILFGLAQAISTCYEKTVINSPQSLKKVAEAEIKNVILQ